MTNSIVDAGVSSTTCNTVVILEISNGLLIWKFESKKCARGLKYILILLLCNEYEILVIFDYWTFAILNHIWQNLSTNDLVIITKEYHIIVTDFRSRRWRSSLTCVCRVILKHLPQLLRSHIRSFGSLGQLLKIPPCLHKNVIVRGGEACPCTWQHTTTTTPHGG